MTIKDLARILVRAADIAEKDIQDAQRDAQDGAAGEPYTREEWAAYRLLRWLADGATELVLANDDEARDRMTGTRS